MYEEIELLNGDKIKVRRLGIFELDELESNIPGPFTYEVKIGDEKHRAIYDPAKLKKIPEKPEIEDPEPGTKEYNDLIQFNMYEAFLAHVEKQREARYEYYKKVVRYILDTCIAQTDRAKIVTEDDWNRVHTVALVPRITKELLAHTFRNTYRASYDNQEMFDAMAELSGGLGMYDAISLWENQCMLEMKMSEIEYSALPIMERARKVCAMLLPKMMEQLDMDRQKKDLDNG